MRTSIWLSAAAAWFGACAVHADPAPFDLAGPAIEVKVTRGSRVLPIAEVPNLSAGDHLWVKADLPDSQSAPYLMVVAFLRGSTNPPPTSWFLRCDTGARSCADGLHAIVPAGAKQVLLFLAPRTGGDFKSLMNAVRGRPGAFVRASQDLNQATLDRARLERYLAAVRELERTDPRRLKEAAPLLARSLAIKVDEKCLGRIPELQAPCLMDGQNSLILDDGHSTSIVQALAAGPAAELAMDASYAPQLNYGYYSPYVASVFDIARILDSFHTANYQYIPALGSQSAERLSLSLNTPPSFHDPKSVLVAALPAVEDPQPPPLHAVDPQGIYCARKDSLVLPVEGAPLVFSTDFAHDMKLHVSDADGREVDLPARADARRGGFVVDTAALEPHGPNQRMRATLRGVWGFDEFEGPAFELVNSRVQSWRLPANEAGAVVVGRDEVVHLQADDVSCIDGFMLRDPDGKEMKIEWQPVHHDEVELKLPLKQASPGALTLLVSQYGEAQPQSVPLQAFAEAARLDSLTLHAGDTQAVLKGSRLDEVSSLGIKGAALAPVRLESAQGADQLVLAMANPADAAAFRAGESATAKVQLNDGRTLTLRAVIDAPRPRAVLLGRSVQLSAADAASRIELSDPGILPQDATLTFSVHMEYPAAFSADLSIEVAAADGDVVAPLNVANGAVTLENSAVAIASLDPLRLFGRGVFGPLRFRVTGARGAGDWQPLVTVVRLPALEKLQCPATAELACKLSGSGLFLIDAVAGESDFARPVRVPDGYPGRALPVPHPTNGRLFVRLRDAPDIVNAAVLAVSPLPVPADGTASTSDPARAGSPPPTSDPAPAGAPPPTSDPAPASSPAPR